MINQDRSIEVDGMSAPRKLVLRNALRESQGHTVYKLQCGAIGTIGALYRIAKSVYGFAGTQKCFADRLHRSGGRATLAELSIAPAGKGRPKRAVTEDIVEAIRNLDERKRELR